MRSERRTEKRKQLSGDNHHQPTYYGREEVAQVELVNIVTEISLIHDDTHSLPAAPIHTVPVQITSMLSAPNTTTTVHAPTAGFSQQAFNLIGCEKDSISTSG